MNVQGDEVALKMIFYKHFVSEVRAQTDYRLRSQGTGARTL